ncbi:unnamed protein product [Linum tenue]|uniref:Uncharacterized protein n=1 Tax=Linum tenue TaxID=586396 RepID=A0AAV0JEP0_9ROSI|nr:unnamed protein product [Linum tenue]
MQELVLESESCGEEGYEEQMGEPTREEEIPV